jgi:hypothetical protein
MPAESATRKALYPRGPDEEFWNPDRQLAASAVDALREQTFAMVKLHGDPKKTRHMRPPKPIQRPGVRDTRKVIRFGGRHGSGADQLATVFGGAAHQ